MKRICCLATAALLLIAPISAGCFNEKPQEGNLIPYEKLYDGDAKEKYDEVGTGQLNRASYGYKCNDVQDYNGWCYVSLKNGVFTAMDYKDGTWRSESGDVMTDGVLSQGDSDGVGYEYAVPAGGNYAYCCTLRKNSADGNPVKLEIFLNGNKIQEQFKEVDGSDTSGRYFSGSLSVNTGDKIVFSVKGKNAYLNPTVSPTGKLDDSLYNTHTQWGFYGDLHTVYHNNKTYLYHLWNHDFENDQWEWNMQTSTDMFRYVNAGYDASFVENHYMAFSKTPNLVDYDQYISGRDCTLFYDEEIDAYRYIGLCYRENDVRNISCDLAMRVSSDSKGMVWDTPAVVLRSFPTTKDGEPECSAFRKIGNRWYLLTGISKQTVHHVGTLTYWIGGEGQNIDQVDWQNAESHVLDGEDLCVPQIENIGGRWYLFGWMPRVYNSGFWGGYKNLSREVYADSDGILHTRIDEMATKLLNKGKLFDIDENNTEVTQGAAQVRGNSISFTGTENSVSVQNECGSTFVTYKIKFGTASRVSYTMTCGDKTYRLSVVKDGNTSWLQVDCPKDSLNPLSSKINLGTNTEEFTVKAVIEGGITEFCVNDLFVLTGRTSMSSKTYTAGFYTDGTAEITGAEINRLAQYYDIYD